MAADDIGMTASVRGFADRARLALITAGGLGFAPVAPGTFGTLGAAALGGLVQWTAGSYGLPVLIVLVVSLTWFGFSQTRFTARVFGTDDPSAFVLDEVAGYLLALTMVWGWVGPPGVWAHLLAFVMFRLFDITKLEPARRLEALPGAAGIMLDDLAAGCWAGATVIGAVGLGWIAA